MTDDKVVRFPGTHPGYAEGDVRALEADLSGALGLPVSVETGAGDHVVTIRANGLEGLDRLCHVIMAGAKAVED